MLKSISINLNQILLTQESYEELSSFIFRSLVVMISACQAVPQPVLQLADGPGSIP
jgi:hypothetical protein